MLQKYYINKKELLFPLIYSLVYALTIMILCGQALIEPPYPFFDVLHNNWYMSVVWFFVVYGIISGITFLTYYIHKKLA